LGGSIIDGAYKTDPTDRQRGWAQPTHHPLGTLHYFFDLLQI
jgi:hypothetical protein